MRPAALALAFGLGVLACGTATEPSPAGAGSAAPSAASSAAPVVIAKPSSLARTATPKERRERDERACEGGDVAGCRRAADRHRGYGHVAGCGVDRVRSRPYRMVSATDADGDARQFDRWIRRACDLGDEEACVQGKNNVSGHSISDRAVDLCTRSKQADCPLYLWQAGMHPEGAEKLAKKRLEYLKSGVGTGLLGDLQRKEKKKGGDALPAEVLAIAERVCKSTLECEDVEMMLDRSGYTPAALGPFRKSAGEALSAACLEGDCVCGEAALYLEPGDARIADLARIGCDDGEPDACYVLARAAEESDPKSAAALYEIACPSISASDGRSELYSKRACDRLAELNDQGKLFDKDSDRGFFYSTLACTRPGFERDHAPCLRRALFHGRGYMGDRRWGPQTGIEVAREHFYGGGDPPGECARPSVQAACKRDEPQLLRSTGQ